MYNILFRTLISIKLRLRRAIQLCFMHDRRGGKIEIQYLFDGLECLPSSKLSLYAFWQQSLLIETEKRRWCSFLLVHSFMLSEFPVVHPPSVSCRTHALDVDCYSNHSRRLMIFFFFSVFSSLLFSAFFYCLCYMSVRIDCSNE
jgi:hypothetical protein